MNWQLGGSIVGVLAVVYGLSVAFLARRFEPRTRQQFVVGGALVILVAGILLWLLPLLEVY